MKRLTLTIFLLFSILAALFLCGCGTLSRHTAAIQTAVVAYSDYYIEVHNLSDQVKEQYKQLDKEQTAIDYTILIDIPDYAALDLNQIDYTPPALDFATMSAAQYKTAAARALRASLESYAYDNPASSYVELPAGFSLVETEDGFVASMSSTSRNQISKTVDALVASLLDSYDAYTQNERFAQIADARFALLNDLFGSDYIALSSVQKVTLNDDGTYEMTLVYPDPYDVYDALAQQYYESYNQPFYGDAITVSLDADDLSDVDTAGMATSVNSVTVALDTVQNTCTLVNASVVTSQLDAAKMQAESAAAQRINAEWRVAEVEAPANGTILEGSSSGNKIIFVSDASLGKYYYVRFYLLPDDDLSETGTLTAGMFIVAGKRASVRLPSGYYRVSCDIGDSWYGLDALFGPDATGFDSNNTIRSRSGYINTISFE